MNTQKIISHGFLAEFEQIDLDKSASSFDELMVETTIRQDGYVYVYLSNEEPYELQVGLTIISIYF